MGATEVMQTAYLVQKLCYEPMYGNRSVNQDDGYQSDDYRQTSSRRPDRRMPCLILCPTMRH
jgi:hypothetical protein